MYYLRSFSMMMIIVTPLVIISFNHSAKGDLIGLHLEPFNDYKYADPKRNTWWSKKSNPMEEIEADPIIDQLAIEDQNVVSSVACYVRECVPAIVNCVRLVDSRDHALECQLQYHECALWCLRQYKQLADISTNFL